MEPSTTFLVLMIASLPTTFNEPMLPNGRNRHADFWLEDGPVKRKLDEEEDFSTEEYIEAKGEITQFVRIMAGRDIEVNFQESSEGSPDAHTDGDVVTIPSEIGENFDATVGTALHESSHVVLSDFDILNELQDGSIVPQDIVDKLEPKLKKSKMYEAFEAMGGKDSDIDPRDQAARGLHVLWNVVEDRWIDNWAYNRRPGYWGYYIQMYNEHWHSDEVSEIFKYDDKREEAVEEVESGASLQDVLRRESKRAPGSLGEFASNALSHLEQGTTESAVREEFLDKFAVKPDWNSYSFRVTNITNSDWNPDALPGLREIWNILDVHNIDRLDSSRESFEVACDIFRVILEHLDAIYVDPRFDPQGGKGEESEKADEEGGESSLPEGMEEILEDQIEHMKGEAGEGMDPEDLEDIEFFESSDVEEVEVGDSDGDDNDASPAVSSRMNFEDTFDTSVSAILVGSVSESFLQSNHEKLEPVTESKNQDTRRAVQEGIEMGKILGNKLRVFDEQRNTKYTRRRKGKLDDNLLAEINFSSRLFYTTETEKYQSGFLHVSVDASGSMDRGEKFERAVKTSVALAQAASMIRNFRCQVSFRSTCKVDSKRPLLLLAYDSAKDSMEYVKNVFPYLTGGGTTPEGLAFESMREQILNASQDKDAYFVNISDGMPYFTRRGGVRYSGKSAQEHTKSEVETLKRADISVLSYYIGSDNEDDFEKMYGDDSEFIDVESISDIRKTMNTKLLNQDETRRARRR